MGLGLRAAQLACAAIYDPITPGTFTAVHRVGDTVCGTVLSDGVLWVVCQGTENLPGWLADVDIAPLVHPVLGPLHRGFADNLPTLVAALAPTVPPGLPLVVAGHSKGAGEAVLLGALLKLAGFSVTRAILFACPHPGQAKLAQWLRGSLPGVSYRNAPRWPLPGDPVPLVPLEPYTDPYPLTRVTCAPAGWRRFIGAEWHRGGLYLRALQQLGAP